MRVGVEIRQTIFELSAVARKLSYSLVALGQFGQHAGGGVEAPEVGPAFASEKLRGYSCCPRSRSVDSRRRRGAAPDHQTRLVRHRSRIAQ